jgi:hypothetical protein
MWRSKWLVVALSLFALSVNLAPAAEPAQGQANAPSTDELLNWLPADTETICVIQEPFRFDDPKKADAKKPESIYMIDVLFRGPFYTTERCAALYSSLVGQKVLRVVEGSRQFESPGDFGMMHYRGCQIIVFDGSADVAWNSIQKAIGSQRHETARIDGTDVLILPKEPNKAWAYYFARPKSNILLAATDRDYLSETLARIGKKSADRALPKELAEWKHVDTKSPMWAVRHFDHKRGPTDFTSPLAPFPDTDSRSDKSAVGVTFSLGKSAKEYVGTVNYLSEAKDMGMACRDWAYPKRDPKMQFRLVEKGVLEIKVRLEGGGSNLDFALKVMRFLGHGLLI